MKAGALDEDLEYARDDFHILLDDVLGDRKNIVDEAVCRSLATLIAAERADAERAQRERADGLERDIAGLRRETSEADKAFESFVTRPYRMAISRWFAVHPCTPNLQEAGQRAERDLRALVTDSDIDAARGEGK